MKKLMLLLLIGILPFSIIAQDVVVLKHTNYTTHFSKSKRYPVLVQWETTKAMVGCPTPLKRKDNFKPDPQLVDETNIAFYYVKSGYDRGHVMPAAENLCQTSAIQDECFYFSNMIPQPHSFNAGLWKTLETLERQIAFDKDSTIIWAGGIGEIKKIGMISVPDKCWKVLYVRKTKKWMAYIFPNNSETRGDLIKYETTVDNIKKITGFSFK
jgi:endonuclease G, mitochondrial